MLDRKLDIAYQEQRDEKYRSWQEQQSVADRSERKDAAAQMRHAARLHLLEILAVSAITIAAIVVQYFTTKMQIDAQAKQESMPSVKTPAPAAGP